MKLLPTIGIAILIAIGLIATATTSHTPYPLDGYAIDSMGSPIHGANVTFTNQNTGEVIYATSDPTYGWYANNAANFPSGYEYGHVIQYYTISGACTNTTTYTLDATGSNTMDITLDIILDTDGDGVPDAWDNEADTPLGHWTNSEGIGRRLGDMNGDGKLSSVDALMILQAAVKGE